MPNNGEGRDRIEKTKFCLYMFQEKHLATPIRQSWNKQAGNGPVGAISEAQK